MLMMTPNEHKRLNILCEKAFNRTASITELKEFNALLDHWNNCVELH